MRKTTLALTLALQALTGGLGSTASAQTHSREAARVTFNIESQPLEDALNQFARQTGYQVLFQSAVVRERTAPRIDAVLTPEIALKALLANTNLRYRFVNPRTVTISSAEQSESDSGLPKSTGFPWRHPDEKGMTLVLAAAQGTPQSDAGAQAQTSGELEEVVVEGVRFRYDAPSTATKLPMSPKDIPQSLTLVTEDVMDFAGIKRFDDIYRVDASAGATHRRDNYPQSFYRGFDTQGPNAIRIDGFRFVGNTNLDLVGFERFEVVKGPSSALFGQNTLGGTLNAVTKQPQGQRAGSLSAEAGSHGLRRGELDFTGPLDEAGRWQYRLIGAYQDTDSYVDIAHSESKTFAPSLSFEPTDRTKFVLTGYYNEQDNVSDWGTGLQLADVGTGAFRLIPLPRSHFYGQPWNGNDLKASIVTLRMEHELSASWRLRMALQRNDVEESRLSCTADGNPNPQGIIESGCWTYLNENDVGMYSGEINLIGDFEFLGRSHTLLLGADYSEQDTSNLFGFDYIDDAGNGVEFGSSIGYDLTRPVGIIPRVRRDDLFFYIDGRGTTVYSGITGQLLLRPVDRLTVLLAGRYNRDRVTDFIERSGVGLEETQGQPMVPLPDALADLEKSVGQVGLTYRLTDNANAYLNWGQTYQPLFDRQFDPSDPDGSGKLLPPEEGEQFEVGLKLAILDNRMDLTVAAFDMERSGISEGDRQHPGFSVPVGAQRSRGVELGVAGEPAPGWELYASAAILDSEFIEGEFTGNQSANAPKRALSLFASYQFQGGPLRGFGAGLGYVHKAGLRTFGAVFDGVDIRSIRFDFGDINELDLRFFYETPRWEAYLAARDLLDDLYYAPNQFNQFRWGLQVNPGRTISAGLTYKLY